MATLTYNPLAANNVALAAFGFEEITGASTAPAGYFYSALVSDIDATYSATTVSEGDDLSSQSRAAGSIRLGKFATVTVTAGTVLGYLSPL